MSRTPRTDAETACRVRIAGFEMTVHCGAVKASFARKLEEQGAGMMEALQSVEAEATYNDEDTIESLRNRLDNLSESAAAAIAAVKP